MMGARTVLDPDTIIHADTDMLYHIPSPPSCTARSAICHSSRILHRAHASPSTTFDDGASDDLFSERYPPTQSNHASHISISSHHRAVCCVSSPRIRIMRPRTGCFSNSDHFYVCPVSASLASHSTLLQVVPLTANGAVAHDIYSSVTTSFIVSHTIPILFVHIPPALRASCTLSICPNHALLSIGTTTFIALSTLHRHPCNIQWHVVLTPYPASCMSLTIINFRLIPSRTICLMRSI